MKTFSSMGENREINRQPFVHWHWNRTKGWNYSLKIDTTCKPKSFNRHDGEFRGTSREGATRKKRTGQKIDRKKEKKKKKKRTFQL